MECCTAKAVKINEMGLAIETDTCTGCMLCTSVCPANSFTIHGGDFSSIIARLKKAQLPVLGCNDKPHLDAHVRTHCLGYLSEEHLLFLLIFIENPLQLNLTECANCRNGFIADILNKRLDAVKSKVTTLASKKIALVENKSDLDYRSLSLSRRDLFKSVKNLTLKETLNLFTGGVAHGLTTAYSEKKLPMKRELMNKTLLVLSGKTKQEVLEHYYYDLSVDKSCDLCLACVSICPTGALAVRREGPTAELHFSSSLCCGCGLCADFCKKHAVNIMRGFSSPDPFEFTCCYSGKYFTSSYWYGVGG